MKSVKSRVLWSLIFLALIVITIYTITSQSKSFSVEGFADFLSEANPFWLGIAFLCMLGFVFFEGMAVRTLSNMFGYKRNIRKNFVYASADIYFSAITPSASGGQPASALFMIGDGIPTTVTTIVLLINLTLYAFTLILQGLVCLFLGAGNLENFDGFSIVLIIFGLLSL